jgi:endonuclease/exonuclease/phosphatase family metal-dependent hydrolase
MNPPSARAGAPTVLVAAVFLVTVELLRATSPLLDLAAADLGVTGAARLAVVIFLAPALLGGVVALAGTGRATLGAVIALLAVRLVAQVQDPATLAVVGTGAAVGVAALVLVIRQAPSGVAAGVGLLLGGVADLSVRAASGSWDPVFRPGVLPWLVLSGIAVVTGTALLLTRMTADLPAGRAWVLGPYLGLYLMFYGSAPIVAAHAGLPLPAASAVLILAAVAGMELIRRMRLPGGSGAVPEPDRWFAGFVAMFALLGAVVIGYWLTGPVVFAAAVVAVAAAAVLLARALTVPPGARPEAPPGAPPGDGRPGQRAGLAVGLAVAAGAAGLGYVVPVMVYQVHYDLEFPFDNRLVLLAAAALLGLAGLGTRPREHEADRRGLLARPARVSAAAALALLVPLAVAVTGPAVAAPDQTGATVRLMSWNVMYGRHHLDGTPDPEAVAVAIEATDPDVVLLQEVSRGWPIGGGVDLLEFLSRRLAMPYQWAPAADGLFGNAVLTRLPLTQVEAVRLPFVQGPMERSYLAATLHLDGGRELRLINAHLQHRKENTPTRVVQSQALLAAWDGAPRTVIAGDFNFWPTWMEARLWHTAGLVSAQDVTGHGGEFTVPSHDPDNRVDWIFGTPDLSFSDFVILSGVTSSDHFPLVVTVELRVPGEPG